MLRHLPWAALTWMRKGSPSLLLHHAAGLGDELLASCVCHELARRDPALRIWMMTRMPELFCGNPDIRQAVPVDPRFPAFARRLGRPVLPLAYTSRIADSDRDLRPPAPILKVMLAAAGVQGKARLRPWIHLSPGERSAFSGYGGCIVVHSSTRSARHPILLKDYPVQHFSRVTARLREQGLRLVQLGATADPLLEGTEDLRGKTTVREAAALLASARLFLGLEGGLMHLARAVETPGVIIYGGRQLSRETGYRSHTNLGNTPECAPCWGWTRCPQDLACLHGISPETIVEAVEASLSRQPGCVDDEEAEISSAEFAMIQAYLRQLAPPAELPAAGPA